MPEGAEAESKGTDSGEVLVCAIAHEIGNHLGAIRLQAHLLDEDLDSHALASSSVAIDGLAGRAGPLLALIRPLLSLETLSTRGVPWAVLFAGLGQHLEDEGTRGVVVKIESLEDAMALAPNVDWIHSLLVAIIEATLATLNKRDSIRMGLETEQGPVVLFLEDDGPEEDLSEQAPLRGRPLAVSIARRLVCSIGGRVEASRAKGKTRIELIFS